MSRDAFADPEAFEAPHYYQPGGQVPFSGVIVMEICALAGAAVLGFLNALGDRYLPSAILRIMLPFAFGAALGGCVLLGVRMGKVRSLLFARLGGAFAAIVGLWLSWVAYFWLLNGWLLWDVAELFDMMQAVAIVGAWAFRGWTPTGWQLWALWAAEACVVMAMAVSIAASFKRPFCEGCNAWTKENLLTPRFRPTDVEGLRQTLESGRYEVMEELQHGLIPPLDHLRVKLYECPACTETSYVSVVNAVTTNVNGTDTTNMTAVIEHLCVPHSACEYLRELPEHATSSEPNAPVQDADPDAVRLVDESDETF